MWDFREYQSAGGKLPVSEWYEKLSPGNKARAKRFIRIARKLERIERPYFKKFRQLWEARWNGENKVPHRIFSNITNDRQVVFLCGCTHKGRRYNPTHAYDTAVGRWIEIQKGEAETHGLNFSSLAGTER